MREHGTRVMPIGKIQGFSSKTFSRLDTPDEHSKLPSGFNGLLWTDHIDVIGPLLAARRIKSSGDQ
jgi:hypothetical protein